MKRSLVMAMKRSPSLFLAIVLATGCAARLPYSDACTSVSSNVEKAFRYHSLDELKANVSALRLADRLDAFVHGMQCVHPPFLFLANTLIEEPRTRDETLRRLDWELRDSERFAYIELMRILHEKKKIDINSDRLLREQIKRSLSRLEDESLRARLIRLFARDGVTFQ